MTQTEQIAALGKMEIDFVGFIFYPKSPRYVLAKMTETEIASIHGPFLKVGVFVNAKEQEVLDTVDACKLDMVQLHGDEAPLYCEHIAARIPVIKAFRLLNNDEVLYKITPYLDVVDYFLFDTDTQSFGGSGKRFDWGILRDLRLDKPFFLSGGISDEHLADISAFRQLNVANRLFSLDINSRFETAPGIKDLPKIEAFLEQLKVTLK